MKIPFEDAATHVGFAIVAGLLGYLMRATENGGRIRKLRAVIESASAGFVGFLALLACRALAIDGLWTGVVVGVLAWLGANASIRMLERLVYRRFGLSIFGGINATPDA